MRLTSDLERVNAPAVMTWATVSREEYSMVWGLEWPSGCLKAEESITSEDQLLR